MDGISATLARGDRGILKIAADLGVGSGTVQRVKAAIAAQMGRCPSLESGSPGRGGSRCGPMR